jgi:hypothetical protein
VTVKGKDQPLHVREGEIHGLLDFADVWAPSAVATRHEDVTLWHDSSRSATAVAVAEDLADMQACVARRFGHHPDVRVVAQWPRELGDSVLSDRWLLLAEKHHWDVADRGVGRWVRRAAMAKELARRIVRDAADLRQGEGAIWLNDGLPGAVGLLCVAETDGLEALGALLSKGADEVAQSLAASATPVGALKHAETDGWAVDYAPFAALDWMNRQRPEDIARFLKQVRESGDIGAVLAASVGVRMADHMLGTPNASDVRVLENVSRAMISGERWQWRDGGWVPVGSVSELWRYRAGDERLVVDRGAAAAPIPLDMETMIALYLDGWPSYERVPGDNFHSIPVVRE